MIKKDLVTRSLDFWKLLLYHFEMGYGMNNEVFVGPRGLEPLTFTMSM